MPARLTVLSGPSGVGKGTVVAALRALVPEVWVSVSCTTRSPRPGETDGVEYHFIDRAQFGRLIDGGEMLEFDEHFGNLYGTMRKPVFEHVTAGVPTLLEIDLHGARQVRSAVPDARFVFLAPPSTDELVSRLARRGTESAEAVAARLERAQLELAAEREFDEVVVNNDVEQAARDVAALVTAP